MSSLAALSVISSLYFIAMDDINPETVRRFAMDQLRRIDASMGVRKARLLADTVSASLSGTSGVFTLASSRYPIPLPTTEVL